MMICCARRFASYREKHRRDASEAELSRHHMLTVFLPAFEAAARAAVLIAVDRNRVRRLPNLPGLDAHKSADPGQEQVQRLPERVTPCS